MITSSRWPLSAAAVLLTVAFVVAPVRVVADSSGHRFRDQGEIVGSLSTAFAAAWAPGRGAAADRSQSLPVAAALSRSMPPWISVSGPLRRLVTSARSSDWPAVR